MLNPDEQCADIRVPVGSHYTNGLGASELIRVDISKTIEQVAIFVDHDKKSWILSEQRCCRSEYSIVAKEMP